MKQEKQEAREDIWKGGGTLKLHYRKQTKISGTWECRILGHWDIGDTGHQQHGLEVRARGREHIGLPAAQKQEAGHHLKHQDPHTNLHPKSLISQLHHVLHVPSSSHVMLPPPEFLSSEHCHSCCWLFIPFSKVPAAFRWHCFQPFQTVSAFSR